MNCFFVSAANKDYVLTIADKNKTLEGQLVIWKFERGLHNQFMLFKERIVAAHSGHLMEPENPELGSIIIQGDVYKRKETWGYYPDQTIRNSKGLCMDIQGGRIEDGTPIILWNHDENALTQKWIPVTAMVVKGKKHKHHKKHAKKTIAEITIIRGKDFPAMDLSGKCDPCAKVQLNGKGQAYTTKIVRQNKSPEWNETFTIEVPNKNGDALHITVNDYDETSEKDLIGTHVIALKDVPLNEPVEKTVELEKEGGLRKDRGEITYRLLLKGEEKKKPEPKPEPPKEEPKPAPAPAPEPPKPKKTVMEITIVSAKDLAAMDLGGKSDPFVVLQMNGTGKPYQTQVIKKNRSPEWNETFTIDVPNKAGDALHIICNDWDDHNASDLIGNYVLPLNEFALDTLVEKTVDLEKKGGLRKDRGQLTFKFILKEVEGEYTPEEHHQEQLGDKSLFQKVADEVKKDKDSSSTSSDEIEKGEKKKKKRRHHSKSKDGADGEKKHRKHHSKSKDE